MSPELDGPKDKHKNYDWYVLLDPVITIEAN